MGNEHRHRGWILPQHRRNTGVVEASVQHQLAALLRHQDERRPSRPIVILGQSEPVDVG